MSALVKRSREDRALERANRPSPQFEKAALEGFSKIDPERYEEAEKHLTKTLRTKRILHTSVGTYVAGASATILVSHYAHIQPLADSSFFLLLPIAPMLVLLGGNGYYKELRRMVRNAIAGNPPVAAKAVE